MAIAVFVALGMALGRIAKSRNHPWVLPDIEKTDWNKVFTFEKRRRG